MSAAALTIERRSNLSYEDFKREYLIPRRPVIFTDALENCPALQWTPQYFASRVGDRDVVTDAGSMRMYDFIRAVTSPGEDKPPFLFEQSVPELFPELMADMARTPIYACPNWLEYPFWQRRDPLASGMARWLKRLAQVDINITGAGVRFPYLHLDRFHCHALISQWCGRKELFVYAPDQKRYLYAKSDDTSAINDVESPDLKRFPKFAKARAHRATLMPGEVLFCPSGWWHTTRTLDVSIATVNSFGNASNWWHMLGQMARNSRFFAFLPFGLYLVWLTLFRLPRFNEPDAVTMAARRQAHRDAVSHSRQIHRHMPMSR